MRRIATLLGAVALVSAAAPAASHAKPARNCPARAGTIAKKPLGRVWHQGHSLFACTTVYGHRPRARRLGPWTPQTRVAFDGVDAAWTTQVLRDGQPVDRAWAGSADTGRRWLTGAQLIPASADAPPAEARIQRIVQLDRGAAWVTRDSRVVLALQDPGGDPEAIGTPPAQLSASENMLLVGSFATTDPATLATTLSFSEKDQDGDECGAQDTYTLTVQPAGAPGAVGAKWDGYWTSTNCS